MPYRLPEIVRLILWSLIGGFFLLFGIQVLVGAYGLKDPFSFVLTFFASNLIILISAVVLVGVFFKVWARWRKKGSPAEDFHPKDNGSP
jgi:hypothetical protein